MANENENSGFGTQKAMMDHLKKKWNVVLEDKNAPVIKDEWRKAVTATLLENMANDSKAMGGAGNLFESPANNAGNFNAAGGPGSAGFTGGSTSAQIGYVDPILINLIRRSMPNLMAYDVCGVQPMNGPTGLIFALRAQYINAAGETNAGNRGEALFNEADPRFSGTEKQSGAFRATTNDVAGSTVSLDPFGSGWPAGGDGSTQAPNANPAGFGVTTAVGETYGDSGVSMNQMGVTIDKTTVTAKTRALKAEYTMEMAQDLKAVHGLDAESELANILSAEILAEINREVVRSIYAVAKIGCQSGTTVPGVFDLSTDSNGRWSVERFKGLLFRLEQEANRISKETRRGKGNILICSSDVASALSLAGVLDYAPALNTNLTVDDTGNTFAGVLNGKMKVYIDPYFTSSSGTELACVGYRGNTPFDAGMFYCPYVPLQLVKTVGQDSFQPRMAFRSRYGLVANPYAIRDAAGNPVTPDQSLPFRGTLASAGAGVKTYQGNQYYRIFKVNNLV